MRNRLNHLPNIGNKLAQKLVLVGIDTKEKLQSSGAENAFIKLRTIDHEACINMLYALEGAIQGIRWHQLEQNRKSELREFYRMIDKEINTASSV